MHEENYLFLVRALGKLGFEDTLNDALRTKMQLNFPSFELKAKVNHGKEDMIHELKFDKKKETGYYFLNEQNVTLIKENKEEVKQKFPFFNQTGFSNDETYNLMKGRSVRNKIKKDGKEVTRWTHIDFASPKNDKDNFVFRNPREEDLGFNLSKAVGNLPVQNLSQEEKDNLLKGLQQGNLEQATIRHNGRLERIFLQADPISKMIQVFNSQMEKLSLSNGKIQLMQEENLKELPETTKKLMTKVDDPGLGKGMQKKVS